MLRLRELHLEPIGPPALVALEPGDGLLGGVQGVGRCLQVVATDMHPREQALELACDQGVARALERGREDSFRLSAATMEPEQLAERGAERHGRLALGGERERVAQVAELRVQRLQVIDR